MSRPVPFTHPVNVRYLEVDRQGVVFNMWYLAYLDDALTAFLGSGGLPYRDMVESGYDVQVVHTELDWHGPLGYGERADVQVRVADIGRTSFTLRFVVLASGRLCRRRRHRVRGGPNRRIWQVRDSSCGPRRPGPVT